MKWDLQTDVAIVGYGNAGGIAAITAHDAKSEVLLLEKSANPGGVSAMSGGLYKYVTDIEGGIKYFTAISGGRVPQETINAFARDMSENLTYARELAKVDKAVIKELGQDEHHYARPIYPSLPGSYSMGSFIISRIPGFKGFPWLVDIPGMGPIGPSAFKIIMDNVEARGIKVLMETPVKKLIRSEDGMIIGVVAESKGREIRIKARKAVILACGGFEQNEWMKRQYLQGVPFYSVAPATHTGDGITMSMEVGADLWHMWHIHGSYGPKFPGYDFPFRHHLGGPRNIKRKMEWILVDKKGMRFMNEFPPSPSDSGHRFLEVCDTEIATFPRIPSYMIYDEDGRRRGPIVKNHGFAKYVWSTDNLVEIEKGYVMAGKNLAELAERIKSSPENEGLMRAALLEKSVDEWNQMVSEGYDPYGRPPGTMLPLSKPPFYAIPVYPILTNTQGGPVHDSKQRVLDVHHKTIPRLYAVGELGSFFAHLYEMGGNLGETISSGRVAGTSASKEERWDD